MVGPWHYLDVVTSTSDGCEDTIHSHYSIAYVPYYDKTTTVPVKTFEHAFGDGLSTNVGSVHRLFRMRSTKTQQGRLVNSRKRIEL